jgi:hypothetical protein
LRIFYAGELKVFLLLYFGTNSPASFVVLIYQYQINLPVPNLRTESMTLRSSIERKISL